MLEISRTFDLQAAHHLPVVPEGHKCRRLHGHTWSIRVVVTGDISPITGWIIDYADLDAIWDHEVHRKLDHSLLNDSIPNPTTEIMAGWMYAKLQPPLAKRGVRLLRIEIDEGGRSRCVLTAEVPTP